jgi:hypothetical protein
MSFHVDNNEFFGLFAVEFENKLRLSAHAKHDSSKNWIEVAVIDESNGNFVTEKILGAGFNTTIVDAKGYAEAVQAVSNYKP